MEGQGTAYTGYQLAIQKGGEMAEPPSERHEQRVRGGLGADGEATAAVRS